MKHSITTLEELFAAVRNNRSLVIIDAPQTIRKLKKILTEDF